MVSVAFTAPGVVGLNVTPNVQDPPAASPVTVTVPPPLVALAAGAVFATVNVVPLGTVATVNVPLNAAFATPAITTVVPTVKP